MKKKILVFGVTGLLGTSIEKIFKKDKNYKFIGCSHRDIDITNHKKLKKLLQKHRPNFVINTVALIGINFCEKNPEKTMNVNAFSVYNLAKICKSLNITLVQISTHAVFDGIKKKPYDENDATNTCGDNTGIAFVEWIPLRWLSLSEPQENKYLYYQI